MQMCGREVARSGALVAQRPLLFASFLFVGVHAWPRAADPARTCTSPVNRCAFRAVQVRRK
jgi:hypothetical protein